MYKKIGTQLSFSMICSTQKTWREWQKMLRDVITLRVHAQVFRSSLQFALWRKALVYQFREEPTRIDSAQEDTGLEGEEYSTVENQLVFEMETSALYCTCAWTDYQEARLSRQAAHTSVVETPIQLSRSRATWGELPKHKYHGRHGNISIKQPCYKINMNNYRRVFPEYRIFSRRPGVLLKR